jgi:nuclease S1
VHETKARKQFAVYVLTHIVGDIHQSLHAADNNDVGGNEVKVRLPWGKNAKLHGAWDTDFVERLYGGKNELTVAKQLVTKFAMKKSEWQKGSASVWVAETHDLAVKITYEKLPGFACGADPEQTRIPLPQDYVDAAPCRSSKSSWRRLAIGSRTCSIGR